MASQVGQKRVIDSRSISPMPIYSGMSIASRYYFTRMRGLR
jgi:hypothetical protein